MVGAFTEVGNTPAQNPAYRPTRRRLDGQDVSTTREVLASKDDQVAGRHVPSQQGHAIPGGAAQEPW